MFDDIKIKEEELKRVARHDVTTAEQYIVYRIKELEDLNKELTEYQANQSATREYFIKENDKLREDIKDLKIELERARAEKSNLLDFKNGLQGIVKLFGWKTSKVLNKKKHETSYFLIDKNKKKIEVDFDTWFAVNMINAEK